MALPVLPEQLDHRVHVGLHAPVHVDQILVQIREDGALEAAAAGQGEEHGPATHEGLVVRLNLLGQARQNARH
jgi:hypothetical protein